MSGKAFLIDTTKCSGCRACQVTCKQWNNLPAEKATFFGGPEYTNPAELSAITFNHVIFFPVDRSNPEKPVWSIMHKKCYHCKYANCELVCPQKAISKVDGWTVIDQEKCIGCGACTQECIYKVPHILEQDMSLYGKEEPLKKDKSYKCHGCMKNKRDVPACAKVCPMGAISYGYRQALVQKAEERLKVVKKDFPKASIYGLHEFGGLNVITILKDAPEKFGLKENAKPLDSARIQQIHDTYAFLDVFTMRIPALKRVAYRISKNLS